MKFTYLELENYIGIYNGMGLSSIKIDMSKCMTRTLIIRGENGSGKSTIFKAMNVFPDGNEQFIPGKPAKKIICLIDHDIMYTIRFFHGIKNNGDRETTKAFISKNINGMDIELNENGNVTSYKDILYSELSLDPNFAALSQLSLDDKGLADKKPAERKRFVNSIIESLEVYNNIYKAISKKSSNVKAMMDSMVSKLGSLGDINALNTILSQIENEINDLNQKKDLATKELMQAHATIKLLDPDGSIQSKSTSIEAELVNLHKELKQNMKKCAIDMPAGPVYALEMMEIELAKLKETYASYRVAEEEHTKKIEELTHMMSDITNTISDKRLKLNSLTDDDGYMKAIDGLTVHSKEVEEYRKQLAITGIDPYQFTKNEYVLALETLKDIKNSVDIFRANFDYQVIEEAVDTYTRSNWPSMALVIDTTPLKNELDILTKEVQEYTISIAEAEMDLEAIKKLSNRPVSCKDDSCYFIHNLIEIEKRNPKQRYADISQRLKQAKSRIGELEIELGKADVYNSCVNQIRIVIREIDKNGAILSKLPNGGIFSSKSEFFKQLLTGDDFSYIEKIYRYIDLANTLDLFHISYKLMAEYQQKCDLYASKLDGIELLQSEIDNLEKKKNGCTSSIEFSRNSIAELRLLSQSTKSQIAHIEFNIIPLLKDMSTQVNSIAYCETNLQSIRQDMLKINECSAHIRYISDQINGYTAQIAPKMQERDGIKFKIQQAEQYNKELNDLRDAYAQIEIVKHYSSPTKGIQLVFMELYMGKILALANELLAFLFNGEYQIQPFIINESEFRIPCLGSGYMNDDISSMSSSQLTMISMILSFSLLHTSSTKYNIIKMDEIDGPLDENNRLMFIDVMNRIMDIMNVEQCVMISHSSELQVDNSDVILLKSSQLSTDYLRGNIIWKY